MSFSLSYCFSDIVAYVYTRAIHLPVKVGCLRRSQVLKKMSCSYATMYTGVCLSGTDLSLKAYSSPALEGSFVIGDCLLGQAALVQKLGIGGRLIGQLLVHLHLLQHS